MTARASARLSEPPGGVVSLLAAVLRGVPRLDGAACVGRGDEFECFAAEGAEAAIAICQRCPALGPCREWTQRRRRSELAGVIGGEWYASKHYRDNRTKAEGNQHDNA